MTAITYLYPSPNITGFLSLFAYMNTVTGGWFWTLVVVSIFIVALVTLSYYKIEDAMIASFFITTVLAILLRAGLLIGDITVAFCALSLAVLVLFRYANREG